MEKDNVLNFLLDSGMWKSRGLIDGKYYFYSNMKGFSSGRYRIEIQKFIRKVNGFKYRVSIFWTPYDPDDLKYQGLINDCEDLKKAIENANKDLLDKTRKL